MLDKALFGRTGHESTRVIFGAAGLSEVTQDEADAVLATLRAAGVNHLDTAADYGEAELRMGPWMAEHREEFFVATKTAQRSGAAARESLERSLERLRIERVDLIQLHNLVEEDDWEQAHAPGGALEALLTAREEGLTRFVGITGHGVRIPRMHLRSLARHDYDSVLLPYNFTMRADSRYRDDVETLIGLCAERDVAVQVIKAVARGRWPAQSSGEHRSWYRPLEDPGAITRAVHYVLGRPGLFLDSSSDYELLPQILAAASSPGPVPSDDEMSADVEANGIEPLFDGAELERI